MLFRWVVRGPSLRPLHSSITIVIREYGLANSRREDKGDGAHDSGYSSERSTDFGFQRISEKEKAARVKSVFENVADKYDLMNDWMSGGVHRLWKDIFIHRINPGNNTKLLDVAGGTGDISFSFLKYRNYPGKRTPPKSHETTERSVLVYDINEKMLRAGEERATRILSPHQQTQIQWMEGDAENMSKLADNSFDIYTIAYGIRNCVHIDRVLEEAYRVLKPGGRFMCLEFSTVSNPIIKKLYDAYSLHVIPSMGQVIAGDFHSYKYLVESIRKFPDQETFKRLIEEAGFRFVTYENLTFGISSIHSGFKV